LPLTRLKRTEVTVRMRPLNRDGTKGHELDRQPVIELLEGRALFSVSPLFHPLVAELVSVPPALAVQRLVPASSPPVNLVGNYTGDFTVTAVSQPITGLLPTPGGISPGEIRFAALSMLGETNTGVVSGILNIQGVGRFVMFGTIHGGRVTFNLNSGRNGFFNSTMFSVGGLADTLSGSIVVSTLGQQTGAMLTLTRLSAFSTAAGAPSPVNAITPGANSAQFFNGGPSFLRPSSAAGTDFGGFIGIQLGSGIGAIGAGAPGDATGVASTFNAFSPNSSFAGIPMFGAIR
jgi:hypothetical protein